ncbi:hypothetical protein MKW92_025957, partial [Papaver armeniacum]
MAFGRPGESAALTLAKKTTLGVKVPKVCKTDNTINSGSILDGDAPRKTVTSRKNGIPNAKGISFDSTTTVE